MTLLHSTMLDITKKSWKRNCWPSDTVISWSCRSMWYHYCCYSYKMGNVSSLYYKLVERLNCIENQKEVYWVDLVHNKLMGMVIMGAQDGAQHVMGLMMSVWSEMWFAFAKSPYVAYTAGWLLNDRIDLIPSQLEKNQKLIDEMIIEMLSNQFQTIINRRK